MRSLRSRLPSRPSRFLGPGAIALAVSLGVVFNGSGDSADGGKVAEAEVRAAVKRYGDAVATQDVQTVCSSLTPALRNNGAEIGLTCEAAFAEALKVVRGARLRIDDVRVTGDTALVKVHTTAIGQPPSDDTLKLVRAGSGEARRISSLSAAGESGPEKEPAG